MFTSTKYKQNILRLQVNTAANRSSMGNAGLQLQVQSIEMEA